MNTILDKKIIMGVSACCMGCPVRYNRRGWDRVAKMGRDMRDFQFHPVCPECTAGLSVPRNPISIKGGTGDDVWENNARVKARGFPGDVTEDLKKGSLISYEILKKSKAVGFIFMEGSPSCGVYRTTLKDKRLGKPPGVFGSLLLKEGYFLIPALDLDSPIKWWDWRRRLLAFAWLKETEIKYKKDIFKIWHILKFLCQEIDEKTSRILGKQMAELPKGFDGEFADYFKKTILEMLRKPSTPAKIENWLWKNYCHYKKRYGRELEFVNPPKTLRSKTQIVKELVNLTKDAKLEGLSLGFSPIGIKA